MIRTLLLFIFILLTFYCYGAGMMDYFAIYEAWKMIPEDIFPAYHQFQGSRIVPIFVISSAVMTLFNILAAVFPTAYVNKKLVWLSLLAYAFDWIFSFTMQIPIQLKLEAAKNMELLDELLRTNWWRFAADTLQFLIVCVIVWQLLWKLQIQSRLIKKPVN